MLVGENPHPCVVPQRHVQIIVQHLIAGLQIVVQQPVLHEKLCLGGYFPSCPFNTERAAHVRLGEIVVDQRGDRPET